MHILVSGLLNTETSAQVRGFPISYYPIDYPFFGVSTAVSGVAFNIAKALMNSAIVMFMYKPVSRLVRRLGFAKPSASSAGQHKPHSASRIIVAASPSMAPRTGFPAAI